MTGVIIVCVLAAAAVLLLACGLKGKPAPQGRLVEFTYCVTGSIAQPYADYRLELLETGEVTLSNLGEYAKVKDSITVSRDVLDRVGQMIVAHKMQNYKESYSTRFEVLDGESWSYHARFDSGESLGSGGYMAYPDDNGLEEICAYLDSCLSESQSKPKAN